MGLPAAETKSIFQFATLDYFMRERTCGVRPADGIAEKAAKINSHFEEGRIHMHTAGELLITAKKECPHGQWLQLLKKLSCPERKARRLMQRLNNRTGWPR
jgi:hypothetical protein